MGALKISVVVPAYNAAEFICDTLDSIRNQTRLADEIIVVDDGSTDRTYEEVRRWMDATDFRVKLVRQDNQGVSSARNTGLNHTTGDLVAFVDSDDVLLPNHHETLHWPFTVDSSIVVSFADQAVFCETGTINESFFVGKPIQALKSRALSPEWKLIDEAPSLTLLYGNYIPTSGSMISIKAARQIGGFRNTLRTSEDRNAMIRLSRLGRFAFSNTLVARKRVHAASLTEGGKNHDLALNALACLLELKSEFQPGSASPTEQRAYAEAITVTSNDALYHASVLGLGSYLPVCRLLLSHRFAAPALRLRHLARAISASFLRRSSVT
jgi:glycosyltransferase involved in cell wall biosynthesis